MKILTAILALTLSAYFFGCSTVQQQNFQDLRNSKSFDDFMAAVGKLTVQDAQQALQIAHDGGDIDLASLQCMPALIDFVQNMPGLKAPTVDGILSINQIKRNILLGGKGKDPFTLGIRKLHVACAAYAGDEARFFAEFSAAVGSAAASGGATTPLIIGPAVPLGALK